MNENFRLVVLQKLSSWSHHCVGVLTLPAQGTEATTVDYLASKVQAHIKSRQEFGSFCEAVDGISFVVHRVRKPLFFRCNPLTIVLCGQLSQPLSNLQEEGIIEKLNNSDTLPTSKALGTFGDSPELVFVFGALFQSPLRESAHWFAEVSSFPSVISFRFVLVELVGSSYKTLTGGQGTALPTQKGGIIQQAAKDLAQFHMKSYLVTDVCVAGATSFASA